MSERKAKIEPRWSYTPPADVVSPELWTHGKPQKRAKSRRKSTNPKFRRDKIVHVLMNDLELQKLDELVALMSQDQPQRRARSVGIRGRGSALLYLMKAAHMRLVADKKRRAKMGEII